MAMSAKQKTTLASVLTALAALATWLAGWLTSGPAFEDQPPKPPAATEVAP